MCFIISAKISILEVFFLCSETSLFLLPKAPLFSTIKKRSVIHILIARTQAGKLVYLTTATNQRQLAALKEQKHFFCPGCGAAMILKAGDVKIPHFAHRSLVGCDRSSEPETPLHIKGKLLLHQFFSEKNQHPELEKYLPSIKQRADVLVGSRYAIEFQCSAISPADIAARTEGYALAALKAVWIRGISEAPQEGIGLLNLRPFEAAMLQRLEGIDYLLAYHPETNRFFYRSSLFYIGGRRWLAKTKSLPAEKQAFPFAVPKKLTAHEFAKLFSMAMNERDRFIRWQQFAKNRFQNPYWVLCYELGFDRIHLPDYIGVPIKGAEIFKVDAAVWQLQALAAQAKGISVEDLLKSRKASFKDAVPHSTAMAILREYLEFVEAVQKRFYTPKEIAELLYAIYCKNL